MNIALNERYVPRLVIRIYMCANRKANSMRQKYSVDDDLEFKPVLRIPKTYLTQLDKVRKCIYVLQVTLSVCVCACMGACVCACVCM